MEMAAFILAMFALFSVLLLHLRVGRLERQIDYSNQAVSFDTSAISDRVKELAKSPANKIQAIKTLRNETGMGLADAKRVVEQLARESS